MSKASLFWKVPLALVGVVVGLVLLLLIAAAVVVCTPSARNAVMEKGVEFANENTDYDIDLGSLYLSPFHHSPMVLYRAYKGTADLPLHIEVDSLFVGHRGQDTLIYVHDLRLRANALTGNFQPTVKEAIAAGQASSLMALPIEVDTLSLSNTVFHSDSMIAAVGVDAIVGTLRASSPGINIAQGQYPLHGLRLSDAYVGIDLRETPPDTTANDTTPMLMAFDVPDGELHNIKFVLTPMDLSVQTRTLSVNTLADVGGNLYDVRRVNIGGASLSIGSLILPIDTVYGDAKVNLARNLITSRGLHARSDSFGAEADVSATALNLNTMRVDVTADADFRGSKAAVQGYYDIDDEAYDMLVNVERVDLSPFLKDSTPVVLAGEIKAEGKGIDINSNAMKTNLSMHLTDCIYDNINVSGLRLDAQMENKTVNGTLHLPVAMSDTSLQVKALTDHRFRVSDFLSPRQMAVDYHSVMRNVDAHVAGEDFRADRLTIYFLTDSATSLSLATDGFSLDAQSPMHVLALVDEVQPLLSAVSDTNLINPIVTLGDLTLIDTLRRLIPDINADIVLAKGSPVQHIIERMGLDIDRVALSLASDSAQTDLALDASIPDINHPDDSTAMRLPAAKAAMRVQMSEGITNATLTADTRLTDGVMTLHDLRTDAALRFDLERTESELRGNGRLTLDDLSFGDMDLGNRSADIVVVPSEQYNNAIRADVRLDDIPLDLVDSIIHFADLDLNGAVRAKASADGLPANLDLSAEVLPLGVSAKYKPYDVLLSMGETPVIMEHNRVDLNGLPIYGVDSTFLALTGDLDLNTMRLDVTLEADSFAPAKLQKGGPIPVYGDLATDIHGKITGPLDSILADVDVTILPVTDITYPIDKKNLAQVKPYGTVNVKYGVADGSLNLGGQVNVDKGTVRYSPKVYPIMPFRVDSGSHVAFNGPIGQTMLDVSASQKVRADVQSEGEETRRVDFITGVRVKGVVDSLGLNALGFSLRRPRTRPSRAK